VYAALDILRAGGWWPDLAIFHIECTYLTGSAEWAFKDADFDRYPGVGYHQRVKAGTLTGADRRAAREASMNEFRTIAHLPIKRKVVENPVGALSRIKKPSQIFQPYQFGDDASKKTCLWFLDEDGNDIPEMVIPVDPAQRLGGRWAEWPRGSGTFVERWANQTDSNQNALTPSDNRWQTRSDTFPGFADAAVEHWRKLP
jgi:hypothetical protein